MCTHMYTVYYDIVCAVMFSMHESTIITLHTFRERNPFNFHNK